ncbi:MAG TPA: phage holin family protein [Opitutaceae bacterium]|nr:phage holin family protein [Opitutaceae bacterium]
MRPSGLNLLVRWLVLALGVALSAKIVPGISYDSGVTLLVVVALLSLFNAILKPVLVLFTLPFVLLSLGLGVWLINALLFLAVSRLVEGFHVRDFWAALWGALIVSVTNIVLSGIFRVRRLPRPPPPPKRDDVIDI